MLEITIKIKNKDYEFKTQNNPNLQGNKNTLFLNYVDDSKKDAYVSNNNTNDCLSRIIQNYYSDIKLYSSEYNQLVEEICKVNDIDNSDYLRTGRRIDK